MCWYFLNIYWTINNTQWFILSSCCCHNNVLQAIFINNHHHLHTLTDLSYTRKFWQWKNWQIWRIMCYSLKFSSLIFTDTLKAYALAVAYPPNFSSPIACTCMVHQNFPMYSTPQFSMYVCVNVASVIIFYINVFYVASHK